MQKMDRSIGGNEGFFARFDDNTVAMRGYA